jgi:hypothetical protein
VKAAARAAPPLDAAFSPAAGQARFLAAAARQAIERKEHRRAISILEMLAGMPDAPWSCFVNLAYCHFALGGYEASAAAMERALALKPDDIPCLNMLGTVYFILGRREEAKALLSRALRIEPRTPTDRYFAGNIRYFFGDYLGSWRELECRWHIEDDSVPLPFRPSDRFPLWDGRELPGQTLIVCNDGGNWGGSGDVNLAGFGDIILLSRFLPRIASRVGRLVVVAGRPAARLLMTIPGVAEVAGRMDPVPAGAAYTSLASLPAHLEATPELIGSLAPYLRPPPSGPSLGERQKRLRVGLVWAGGAHTTHDADRSCPSLELLRPLLEVEEVEWVSLQMGERAKEAEGLPIRPMPEVRDFADTAFLLTQLDLLITIDSAAANLAGAMGLPVWVMIPTMPEFRWPLEGETTVWYPTARLFRREHTRDWPGVVERVREALLNLLHAHHP